ncbi:small integral membrane protein 4 [Diaphorina citri]|uniref:Small integral membrane protein 4 n=1 Tax=Diaphorina citri TaxID=121845 RepID=A0A1S4EAB4_DIACI|nr:small integral membrane protein 4 [Diaphorina citri]XP_017299045.1 small integral membrane protein 4 [Diaphorina citri]XP_017299046.1 small integral membrane protein 4 [Diaphorina citri]
MGAFFYSLRLKRLLKAWPGQKYFGIYRFLPLFFGVGAALEFAMIKWEVNNGEINFYKTYKRNQAVILAEERLSKLEQTSTT